MLEAIQKVQEYIDNINAWEVDNGLRLNIEKLRPSSLVPSIFYSTSVANPSISTPLLKKNFFFFSMFFLLVINTIVIIFINYLYKQAI